jgi:predicted nucleic acid-binding Zn ribbon protein
MAGGQKNPLEGVLKDIISSLGGKGKFTQEDLGAAWEAVVGKTAATHSKPKTLKGPRLVVNVDESGWLYELTIQKKSILVKLSTELKSKRIKDITFRIGELR